MEKVILKIDNMMCGMCESHINDAIRHNFDIKKVTSSHAKGETVIICEKAPDEEKIKKVISDTGYELKSILCEPYEEKSFLSLIFGKNK